jgi:small GTP-binding protein
MRNNLNQTLNLNTDDPELDIVDDKEDFIAKSQMDIKNLEVFEFKIILVGDPGVGKTSIMTKFVSNEFQNTYLSTIGVEFKSKEIHINNNTCARLKIWDTCGQEKFRAITRQYFKNSEGVFVVFDLTNKETIKKLDIWMKDIKDNIDNDYFIFLIGNKSDVKDRDLTIAEEAKQFAINKKINYYEVSAKTGSGIYNIFEKMASKLINKKKIEKSKEEINTDKIDIENKINKNFNLDEYNHDRGTIEPVEKKSRCC